MKTTRLLLLFVALMGSALSAMAQIPRTITYQGRAADASGPIENVTRQVVIAFYDPSGAMVWQESQNVPFRTNGIFTIAMGAVNPIPDSLGFDEPYEVGLTIIGFNGGNELPRIPLRSVPYAFTAEAAMALLAPATIDGNTTGEPTLRLVAEGKQANAYALVTDGVDSTAEHFVAGGEAGSAPPMPGAIYRDNAPVAWGQVAADGTLLSHFGVTRVSYSDNDLAYSIYLDTELAGDTTKGGRLDMSVVITAGGTNGFGQPSFGMWQMHTDPSSGGLIRHRFDVQMYTYNEPSRAPFTFVVFGRPYRR